MTRTPTRLLTVVPLALLLAACSAGAAPGDPTGAPAETASGPRLEEFGVSAGHPLAAAAGAKMLRDGGTAVDAAIAAAFADAVVQPASSGIGGGGFWVGHDARTGKLLTIDGRETAPAAADPRWFYAPAKRSRADRRQQNVDARWGPVRRRWDDLVGGRPSR